MPICKLFKLPVGFFWSGLLDYKCFYIFEVFLVALISEIYIFCKNIGGEIVVVIFAIEEKKVLECFGWEGRIIQKEVEFFEAVLRIVVDVHQGLIHERDGI